MALWEINGRALDANMTGVEPQQGERKKAVGIKWNARK